MSTSPLTIYHKKCIDGIIIPDDFQIDILKKFTDLQQRLIAEYETRKQWWQIFRKPKLVTGIYLWGGVGIGKTFMMDCFFESIFFKKKLRMHFHAFMRSLHQELRILQGHKNPLDQVAEHLAEKAMLLCFDELFVSDITDAMLLGKLFKALFDRGVCLVATSNIAPDDLYKNGLQRSQFLPAIHLLKANTQVLHISSTIDYRMRHLKEAGVFYTPLNDESAQKMRNAFNLLAQNKQVSDLPIVILNREINIIKQTDTVVWFDFKEICSVPRSQQDYLAIADRYKTVFISNIPVISAEEKDTICLFISLIDVFYDARVKLVFSAAEPVEKIYSRGYKILEYTRTHSRLLEMQSVEYFAGEA